MSKCCNERPIVGPIVPFNFWTAFTPVVPDVYKEAISPQQQIHDMCCMLHKLVEYANMLGENINIDHGLITKLQEAFDKFMESGFDDYYKEQIQQWIEDHLVDVLKALLNHGVFFGLTEDGYFCANIVWQLTTIFDTVMDYSSENYGRLTLTY